MLFVSKLYSNTDVFTLKHIFSFSWFVISIYSKNFKTFDQLNSYKQLLKLV